MQIFVKNRAFFAYFRKNLSAKGYKHRQLSPFRAHTRVHRRAHTPVARTLFSNRTGQVTGSADPDVLLLEIQIERPKDIALDEP